MGRILATGASGMVGSHLVAHLLNLNQTVVAMKRPASDLTLLKKVLNDYQADIDKVQFIEADLLDIFSIDEALDGVSSVYHCAAQVSFDAREFHKLYSNNVTATSNLVNACLHHKIQKFGYVSSVASLGRSKSDLHIDENTSWQKSKLNSQYAISKFAAENEVWRAIAEGLDAIIVNPGIILGRGTWQHGSSALFKRIYDGLKFYTNGVNGFVDVRDVCAVMISLMESSVTAQRFVLVSESLPYKQLFEWMADAMRKPAPDIYAGPFLRSMAWRFDWLKSRFFNRQQLITRETSVTAGNRYHYSNKKITNTLHHSFIPVKESVEYFSRLLLDDMNKL